MNAPTETNKSTQQGAKRELNAAIIACFSDAESDRAFPQKFAELTAAMTNASGVSIWTKPDADTPLVAIARVGQGPDQEVATHVASLLETTQAPIFYESVLACRILLPGASDAILVLRLSNNTGPAQSMAYERLSLLLQLTYAHFQNGMTKSFTDLALAMRTLVQDGPVGLQMLADMLAEATGSDFVATAFWTGRSIETLKISGQVGFTKRAQIPAEMQRALATVARSRMTSGSQICVPNPDRGPDLCIHLQDPKSPGALLALTAGLYTIQAPKRSKNLSKAGTWLRRAGVLAVLTAIAFIPIPDAVRMPAMVEALEKRVVTAPLTTVLSSVEVSEGQDVKAGDTVVVLDARDSELELIRLRAERSAAVIEQETARFSGNAAALRNAELTIERMDARIALEQSRVDSAQVRATISGVVVLDDLRQRVGGTVRQGDQLLEISAPGAVDLTLTILERDIGKVDSGNTGQFRPDFDPSLTLEATVTTLSPAIDLTAEVPVATATATLEPTQHTLRPGVTGVFRVETGTMPIWQAIYTRARNWVLLRVWL